MTYRGKILAKCPAMKRRISFFEIIGRALGVKPLAVALYNNIILYMVVFSVINIDESTKQRQAKARGENVGAYYNA